MRKAFKWGAAGAFVTTAGVVAGMARRQPRVGPGGRPVIPARPPAEMAGEQPPDWRQGIDSPRPWTSAVPGEPEPPADREVRYGGPDEDVTYTKPGDS